MDYNTRRYIDTQKLARIVILTKNGYGLDSICSSSIDHFEYIPDIPHWYRLNSYRANTDTEHTDANLIKAAASWIGSSRALGSISAFVMVNEQGTTGVLYGSNRNPDSGFRLFVPECSISEIRLNDRTYRRNGMFTGVLRAEELSDKLISSAITDYYVACVLLPVSDGEIASIIENDRTILSRFSSCNTYHRITGKSSRRDEEIEIPEVANAIDILKNEIDYLEENAGQGFVRAIVRYGTEDISQYGQLTSVIESCFRYDDAKGLQPPRHFDIYTECNCVRDYVSIPLMRLNTADINTDVQALTLQTLSDAGSFCKPPKRSCKGFYVRNYNITEDSPEAFPVVETINDASVTVGTNFDGIENAVIPLRSLHSHAFITGATETGKTTTTKRILTELHDIGVNFTVIEAAKKEYHTMINDIPGLRVYTAGADGIKLSINPLQPEDGILIENHVDAVVRALLASTGGEHPIPEAYKGLLKQTYSQFGWEYGMLAYTDEFKPFPTFADVFSNVDKYISEHAGYGAEVRQNLCAALSLRSETMNTGALGSNFNNNFGLKAKDFLDSPTVIELSDFSVESVTFLMNILLFKFQSFLSRQPECNDLKRVIVVEEAHNVFKKTQHEDTVRAMNNDYFDKMLSEIRTSGTGLIISDQTPSIMSEAVMINTSVKIVHAINYIADRKYIGESMNLSEFQIKKIYEFRQGECLISLRGKHGVQHCITKPVRTSRAITNAACLVCPTRFSCKKDAVCQMIGEMDSSVVEYYVSRITADPYNPVKLESNVKNMLYELNVIASNSTKLCFLGEALKRYGKSSVQENRIIVNTYGEYLKRRG